jgi:hypothetical protein
MILRRKQVKKTVLAIVALAVALMARPALALEVDLIADGRL